jgi:broad specificity phosphatase PhoE
MPLALRAPHAPSVLWFVRHGESASNVARFAALAAGSETVDVPWPDHDVPLSPLGERQATALGRWFAGQPPEQRPTVVIASPYARAWETARRLVAEGAAADGAAADGAAAARLVRDERWREKELGLFHDLMRAGVQRRHPEQWALREHLGMFWYRPPNGESGADVATRVRAALDAVATHFAGERVLVVCHQVTILCARYVLEGLTEREVETAWHAYDLANCSVTSYRPDADGRLALARLNFTVPVSAEGERVTAEPDATEAGLARRARTPHHARRGARPGRGARRRALARHARGRRRWRRGERRALRHAHRRPGRGRRRAHRAHHRRPHAPALRHRRAGRGDGRVDDVRGVQGGAARLR